MQQMVPQTTRKQSEGLTQIKYELCWQLKKTLTMSGTDDYHNILFLIRVDATDSAEMASDGNEI